jgi:hypothetical protein
LVVACGVEGELGEDESVVAEDCGVEVVDEADDFGAGVGSSDSEVRPASRMVIFPSCP